MDADQAKQKLIDLYQQMYELTEPECACSCRCPRSCCSPEYCEMAIEMARQYWDVDLEPLRTGHDRLPFMGEKGCVVAPHLRPLCTLHTCDVGSFGVKVHPAPDPAWDKKYWRLRGQIDKLSWTAFGEL